jgi:hypothetical protein
MAMNGLIFPMAFFPMAFFPIGVLMLIACMLVGMLNGAMAGDRGCQGFGMMMMRHQVVSQEY